jgi:hypothetical protein
MKIYRQKGAINIHVRIDQNSVVMYYGRMSVLDIGGNDKVGAMLGDVVVLPLQNFRSDMHSRYSRVLFEQILLIRDACCFDTRSCQVR